MKIARINHSGVPQVAIVDGDSVQPLAPDVDVTELLVADVAEREQIVATAADGDRLDLAGTQLLSPVEPKTLRDFLTFEEHLEGSMKLLGGTAPPPAWYEQPVFYFSNTNAVVGPDDPVAVPPGSEKLDFELELAAVIGKPGKDLSPSEARDHIAGYTLFNDWSARDLMASVIPVGLGPVKGKDFANSLGPWIVTADELERYRHDDRLDLAMHAEINGVELPAGGDSSASMAWSFEEMVAYASRGAELVPGDILASGTCGAGCLLEYWGHNDIDTPSPLRPGDKVTLVVQGIGALSNTVIAGTDPIEIPRARVRRQRRPREWDAVVQS